jgi:hypothetical protein
MPPEKKPLQLKIALEGKPDSPIDVKAYAFDSRGNLLASAPLKDGQAGLDLTDEQAKGARVFFAALHEGREKTAITLDTMTRVHAYEPALTLGARGVERLYTIPEIYWRWWRWCRCQVRGKVVKPVEVGGVVYDKPVCNARVHICEVDRWPWIIWRLPDDVVFRLREELVKVRPIPEPDPPVFRFDPAVIDPSPVNVARMVKSQLTLASRAAAPKAASLAAGVASRVALNPQPLPPRTLAEELPLATRASLGSSSATVVRQALADNLTIIRPWICRWDWLWPYFCTCDEIDVEMTNHQGSFQTDIWYPCYGDHPDLFFWIEFSIGGTWTTVYRPSVCCHTYWDYACGSEVTLRISDPRVPWCDDQPPLPGKQLAVLSIGHEVSMTEIQRSSAGGNEGLTTDGRPFGGSLEPVVWFGDGLIGSGITHYRWSYRRLGSVDEADWKALDHEVVRHYAEILADSTLTFKPYSLGPDPAFTGRNLFKIRPVNPPLHPGAVSASWAPEVDARTNTASGYFLSHLLESGHPVPAAGRYELKLELFKSSDPSHPVNLTDEAVLLKVPTVDAPFGFGEVPTQLVAHFPAQPADMEDRVRRSGGKIVAFRLVLHVDNNPCEAEIHDVRVNLNTAGDCGFIPYPADAVPPAEATVSFLARHPNNFATFDFEIDKGSCGLVSQASASGSVAGPTVNGFTRDAASEFTKNVPVVTLLNGGTCGTHCIKAAFSETLHVYALATDGWSSLSYLDDPATPKAFALEPA